MKAHHVTVTVKAICPDGQLPEGITLPDLAYRVATGLLAIESLTFRARPATREEIDRRAAFLVEWSKPLPEFAALMDAVVGSNNLLAIVGSNNLPAIEAAGNIGRVMIVEPETRDPGENHCPSRNQGEGD